jgi:hypothetical protein
MKFILKTIKLFLSIIIINNTAEIQFVGGKISKHHGGNPAKFKHFVYNRKLDILTSNSIFSLFKWNSEIEYIKRNGNNFVKKLFSGCLPPLFIFLLSISQCVASPLNKQRIEINGPFFQGWLLRTIDHEKNASFIFIVGSFSFSGKSNYDQHYVFCAYNSIDFKIEEEIFPNKDDVSIIGSQPTHAFSSNKPLNITWTAKDHGKFVFTENSCEANFKFNSNFKIKFSAINRIPWSSKQSKNLKTSKLVNVDGPEGWLGYTTLLPCHYFIHSIGSRCQYEIEATVQQKLKKIEKISGNGYSHIEGNHGTFFPSGWIWSQSINNDNTASFSLTGGKFLIGSHSSMNFIFFLRKRNGEKVVFRSTDFDIFKYKIDPFNGSVKITAKSFFNGNNRIEMSIESQKPVHKCFGTAIYIPTAKGELFIY